MQKTMLKKKKEQMVELWRKTESPRIVDVFLLGVLLLVTMLCFLYGDVLVTIEHSFNFLDCLFSGKVLDFYQVAIEQGSYGHPAVYEVPIYVVFALWNLPVYILNKIIKIDYVSSYAYLLWAKSMMVFFTVFAAKIVMDIAEEFGASENRKKWAGFFFLSSVIVIVPALMIVQYDIVAVFFMLLGIKAYIRNNRKGFILWFMLANTMKLFGVFIFVPLILLTEKRIFPVLKEMVLGLGGILLCKILYGRDVAYIASTKAFSGTMLERLQSTGFQWQYEQKLLPLFIVLMVGVCIFAYWKKEDLEEKRKYWAIYLPLLVFLGFICLVPFNPYWMILVAPYMVLTIIINPKYQKINILLDSAVGFLMVWISVIINYPVFGKPMLSDMLLGKFVSMDYPTKYFYVSQIFEKYGFEQYFNLAGGVLCACAVGMLVINYPKIVYTAEEINGTRIERGVVWLRGVISYGFVGLMILCYILPDAGLIYSSISGENVYSSGNLLSEATTVEEEWSFDQNLEIKRMDIAFTSANFEWIDSSIVELSLEDVDNGNKLWETSMPVNLFEKEQITFDLGELELQKDKKYVLKISAYNGEGREIGVKLNKDSDRFMSYENGVKSEGNICLNLYGVWKE